MFIIQSCILSFKKKKKALFNLVLTHPCLSQLAVMYSPDVKSMLWLRLQRDIFGRESQAQRQDRNNLSSIFKSMVWRNGQARVSACVGKAINFPRPAWNSYLSHERKGAFAEETGESWRLTQCTDRACRKTSPRVMKKELPTLFICRFSSVFLWQKEALN